MSTRIVEKYEGLAIVTSKKFSREAGVREIYIRGTDYPHPEIYLVLHPGDVCVEKGDKVCVSLDAWADVTTREDGSTSWAGSDWKLRHGTQISKIEEAA